MAVLLFLTTAPLAITAQCPTTTYSVGSGASPAYATLSSAPSGVANLTAGQSIKVTGTFTVDAGTWNITGASVYLTSNTSEIVVNSGTTLAASSSATFQGCTNAYKWLGIRVLAGGTITASDCTFTNGLNAVYIAGSAVFRLNGNTFNTCTSCIRILGQQTPANHTVSGNSFTDMSVAGVFFKGRDVTLGSNTYTKTGTSAVSTGVVVEAGQNLIISGGTMTNLFRGLEINPTPGSQCVEMADVVFTGTTGVYSDRLSYGLNIHDCIIRAKKNGIDIKNHKTALTPPFGVACDGNINIQDNLVNSSEQTCIRVTYINGNGMVTIDKNIIGSEASSIAPGVTFYGIEATDILKADVTVTENIVRNAQNLTSITNPGGIYLNKCKANNTVSNNIVKAGEFSGLGDFKFGITVANSPHCTASDNLVDGGPNTMDRAISIENPETDIDLCCNDMHRATKGLYVLGMQEDCIIQTSTFGTHTDALYYDMVVSSGGALQYHLGNDWSGASTTNDGYFNGNPLQAATVKYRVDDSLLPNDLTQIVVTGGSPSDWFSTPSATELTCISACGNGFAGEDDELSGNDYWAMSALADASYSTLQWIAKQNLYAKLLKYPDLLEDTEADDFFKVAEEGNIGKFYAIEMGIANLYDPELTEDPEEALSDLKSLNDAITTDADYEAYEQAVNTIHLKALANDDWDFDGSEKTIIDGIAGMCPQLAGNAVYTARFLQENYQMPDWNMDCAFVGDRTAIVSKVTGFAAYPNPANDVVNIELEPSNSLSRRIELVFMTGQSMFSQNIPVGAHSAILHLENYPNGYYFLHVSDKGQRLSSHKLTIIH